MQYAYVVRNTETSGDPVVCVTRDPSLAWTLARNIMPKRPWELPDQYEARLDKAVVYTVEVNCAAPEVE